MLLHVAELKKGKHLDFFNTNYNSKPKSLKVAKPAHNEGLPNLVFIWVCLKKLIYQSTTPKEKYIQNKMVEFNMEKSLNGILNNIHIYFF